MHSRSAQFQITTAAGPDHHDGPGAAPATVGLQYGQSLDAAGGRSPYVWSITSGGLPAGITLNTTTGALSGVPSAAGAFQFTVDVSDSLARKASKQFSSWWPRRWDFIGAAVARRRRRAVAYSQSLAATGGTPPYLWSITAGGLPAGLSLSTPEQPPSSGRPTLGRKLHVHGRRSSDNNSVTASKQFTLAVTSNLTITTASPLPDARAGSPYARSLIATGGVAALRLDVDAGIAAARAGTRPGQATRLRGRRSANGTFAFTLQVADTSGGSATRDYTLAVSSAAAAFGEHRWPARPDERGRPAYV